MSFILLRWFNMLFINYFIFCWINNNRLGLFLAFNRFVIIIFDDNLFMSLSWMNWNITIVYYRELEWFGWTFTISRISISHIYNLMSLRLNTRFSWLIYIFRIDWFLGFNLLWINLVINNLLVNSNFIFTFRRTMI